MDNPEQLATRRRITKQKDNTIYAEHHYTQNMYGSILPVK